MATASLGRDAASNMYAVHVGILTQPQSAKVQAFPNLTVADFKSVGSAELRNSITIYATAIIILA